MMGKFVFVIIVIVWFLSGVISISIFDNKNTACNWGFVFTILVFLMLPLFAHLCGLL